MPLPTRLLPLTVEQRRSTNQIFAGVTCPFTKVVTRTDAVPAYALLVGTGLSSGLTVSILGSLSGVNQSETVVLPIPGSGSIRSTKAWSGITYMSTANSPSGSLAARMTFGSGQPAMLESSLTSSLRGRLQASRQARFADNPPGQTVTNRYLFYTNDLTLVPEDVLVVEGIRYLVIDAPVVYNARNKDHVEAVVERLS